MLLRIDNLTFYGLTQAGDTNSIHILDSALTLLPVCTDDIVQRKVSCALLDLRKPASSMFSNPIIRLRTLQFDIYTHTHTHTHTRARARSIAATGCVGISSARKFIFNLKYEVNIY